MVRGHWLDPLARKLLQLTGNIPKRNNKQNFSKPSSKSSIESELYILKQKQKRINDISKNNFLVDVNRATFTDWAQLPGCTPEMINLLLKLQNGGVQLSGIEDLADILELPIEMVRQWEYHLIFRWYGEPPLLNTVNSLDLNSANLYTIKHTLNWPENRVNKLIKERQRRPFQDLADLQERLTLPPSSIEKMIGKVKFGKDKAGPSLPQGY